MATGTGPVSVGDLAAAVVAQDPALQNELKGLVQDMVGHMRHTMRHGDPASKTAMAKAIVPQLLTAISKVEKSAAVEEQRAAYDRMLASIRGDVEDTGNAQEAS